MRTRQARRWIGAAVTAGVIAGGSIAIGSLLASSGSSGASGSGHRCGVWGVPDDDGLVTDLVHHSLEPIAPELHDASCSLQGSLQVLGCTVPGLELLRGHQSAGWECIGPSL